MKFEVWVEGYIATCEHGRAIQLGVGEGEDFKSACVELMSKIDPQNNYYNEKTNTYWACSLYDNKSDAQVKYG